MTSPADDDSEFLGKIGDAVDDVLGEDLVPQQPTDPWERRQRALDSWTAILLGLAAVLTAWASFQASQWGGAQSDAQSAASVALSNASRTAAEATRAEVIDSQMWISWLEAVNAGDTHASSFLRARFSPPLDRAQDAWLAGVTVDASGRPTSIPTGMPMDRPAYVLCLIIGAKLIGDAISALT
jgi:hypothetical protein